MYRQTDRACTRTIVCTYSDKARACERDEAKRNRAAAMRGRENIPIRREPASEMSEAKSSCGNAGYIKNVIRKKYG